MAPWGQVRDALPGALGASACVCACAAKFFFHEEVLEALGVWLGSLYARSPGFLVEPVWVGEGEVGEQPEGTAPGSWPRALREAARRAAGT